MRALSNLILITLLTVSCLSAASNPAQDPTRARNDKALVSLQAQTKTIEQQIAQIGQQLRTTQENEKRAPLIEKWHALHKQKNQLQKQIASIQAAPDRKNDYAADTDQMRKTIARRRLAAKANELRIAQGKVKPNPLVALSNTHAKDWKLDDRFLVFMLSFTLREPALMQQVLELRQKELAKWQEWQKHIPGSPESDSAYTALRNAMTEQVKATWKTIPKEKAPAVADQVIYAEMGDTGFIQQMVAHIAGRGGRALSNMPAIPGYEQLFTLLLGYDYDSSPYHNSDEVRALSKKGQVLTDLSAVRQAMARMLIAYRSWYDTEYSALRADLEYSFLHAHESNASVKGWAARWREDEYLRPTKPSSSLNMNMNEEQKTYEQWQELRNKSQAQAHKKAREYLADVLEEVASAMAALNARLDVLRIDNQEFSYPAVGYARGQELDEAHVYSILAGLLCRCAEQGFVKKTGFGAQALQQMFVREMVSQRRTKHIPLNVPSGEKPQESDKELRLYQRMAYEAKMYTVVSPSMDVFRGEAEMERKAKAIGTQYIQAPITEALTRFRVPYGRGLYESVVALYGKVNLIAWQLPHLRSSQEVLEALRTKLTEVTSYLKSINLAVDDTSPAALRKTYGAVLRRLVSWNKSRDISFEKPESLREAIRVAFAKDQRVEKERESLRATYQLLWLCVWQRLRTVTQLRDGQTSGVLSQSSGAVADKGFADNTLVTNDSYDRAQGQIKAGQKSKVTEAVNTLKEEFGGVAEHFTQVGKSINRQANALQEAAVDEFAEKGELSGVVNHMNGLLGEIGAVLPGFNRVLSGVYNQSERTYGKVIDQLKSEADRMLATIKALMIYVFWLNRYSDRKIKGLQGTLSELLNSWIVRNLSKVGAAMLGEKIRKALRHVSEEDSHLQRKMKESLEDVTLAWQGKRKADELAGIPANEVDVVAPMPIIKKDKSGPPNINKLAAAA